MEIKYFDRSSQQLDTEKVYGEAAMRWLYESRLGRFASKLLVLPFISRLYGFLQSASVSQKKIAPFVRDFKIPMEEFVETSYKSFNDFFIRKFKPGMRTFTKESHQMPAFCEARYYGHEKIDDSTLLPVKGAYLKAQDLLANSKWAETFKEGPFLIARLCPVDYHCFHFPDDGQILDEYPVRGILHSVNPLALEQRPDIFLVNDRYVSILETKNFGKLAYIEVGAICVGKIVQTHTQKVFSRGDEKGHFLFGGSTVILLGEKGKWKPEQDILDWTKKGKEVLVKLGDALATKGEKHL